MESCLFSSAEDLGAAGKDIYFGYGLLQADNAYFCLRDERKCCGESTSYVSPSAIESPSQTPALTPSQSISPTLSSSRTDVTPIPSESMISVRDITLQLRCAQKSPQLFSHQDHFISVNVLVRVLQK